MLLHLINKLSMCSKTKITRKFMRKHACNYYELKILRYTTLNTNIHNLLIFLIYSTIFFSNEICSYVHGKCLLEFSLLNGLAKEVCVCLRTHRRKVI